MTPGKLIYHLYHKPIALLQTTLKTGIKKTAEIKTGRKQMLQTAGSLKEVVYNDAATYHVYFLTGKNYWFQTAFCLYSLQKVAGLNIHATIVDDGSFDDKLELSVKQQFPTTSTVIRINEINNLLNQKLPEDTFPVLRKRRMEYPHLRKLTDVHVLPGDGPKLVLDSDMLFFHKPVELLQWLENPEKMLFMRDVEESYGYTTKLMQALTKSSAIPNRLNVGVAGIPSKSINWTTLELWTKELLEKEGSSYLQEQALTAMIAAGESYSFLDENSYKVLPLIKNRKVPETLHHYVAEAKYDYFVKGWRYILCEK